jgi:hypothetical protein
LQQDFWYFLPVYITLLIWAGSFIQRKKPEIMYGIVIFGLNISVVLLGSLLVMGWQG